MLQMTPQALHLIRSARESQYSREKTKRLAKAIKAARTLNRDYRRRLIEGTAIILRQGDPTPFQFEAFCRHHIRAGLCLRGWTWADADATALEVVAVALRSIGAKRPTWVQGQPEHVQFGVILVERTRCIVCGWKLPPENRKFCGKICHTSHRNRIWNRFKAEEVAALREAANAA